MNCDKYKLDAHHFRSRESTFNKPTMPFQAVYHILVRNNDWTYSTGTRSRKQFLPSQSGDTPPSMASLSELVAHYAEIFAYHSPALEPGEEKRAAINSKRSSLLQPTTLHVHMLKPH
jgi:hypothetical protein